MPSTQLENKVWYLKQSRLFERTGEDDIGQFASLFIQKDYPRRSLVFDYGDPSHNVFLLKAGMVRLSRITQDGKEVSLALLGPGDIFGEECLFERPTRTTIARCVDASHLCSTRAQDLFKILASSPILSLNVAKYLSERLDEAQSTVEEMSALRIPDRIMHMLDRLAHEYGVKVADGTKIDVHLTHADIASMIGSTRETVSLEMGNLVRAGLVRSEGRAGALVLLRAP
ncbi:MAG: Crp/Fnr family transcriptional regulator [Vulcanimicrobiaceae bacterium]